MKRLENFLLAVTFIVAFLGIINLAPKVVTATLIICTLIYLLSGWLILLPEKLDGTNRWIPFLVSYLIAQTILAVLFGINDWPMKAIFTYFTIILNLIAIGVLSFSRKSLSSNFPLKGYLLRLIICFMYSCAPLWMTYS